MEAWTVLGGVGVEGSVVRTKGQPSPFLAPVRPVLSFGYVVAGRAEALSEETRDGLVLWLCSAANSTRTTVHGAIRACT